MRIDMDTCEEILVTITRNKTRSLLTAFGVFWGIFMLVALIGGGQGMQEQMKAQFEGFATNSGFIAAQKTSEAYKGFRKGRWWDLEMEDVEVCAFVKEQVGEYPLYISIDKDVLCETDADTNWSQGDMRLSTMMKCLGAVREKCVEESLRILGVDICGECDAKAPGNSALNDRANAALLEFFTSTDVGEDIEENKNGTSGGNR